MSEQTKMEVKLFNEWTLCAYVSPKGEDGVTLAVFVKDGSFHAYPIDNCDVASLLRPVAAPVAEVEVEGQRKFVPTPHEPVEGVRLTNGVHFASCYGYGAYVSVDGKEPMHYLQASGIIDEACCFDPDTHRHPILHKGLAGYIAALTAFRDRIRQQRNAKAEPKDAPRTWTRAEIISIAESVR